MRKGIDLQRLSVEDASLWSIHTTLSFQNIQPLRNLVCVVFSALSTVDAGEFRTSRSVIPAYRLDYMDFKLKPVLRHGEDATHKHYM